MNSPSEAGHRLWLSRSNQAKQSKATLQFREPRTLSLPRQHSHAVTANVDTPCVCVRLHLDRLLVGLDFGCRIACLLGLCHQPNTVVPIAQLPPPPLKKKEKKRERGTVARFPASRTAGAPLFLSLWLTNRLAFALPFCSPVTIARACNCRWVLVNLHSAICTQHSLASTPLP